jgi:hypothetical protein
MYWRSTGCPITLCVRRSPVFENKWISWPSVQTDDVGVVGSALSNEYSLIAEHFGLSSTEVCELARSGIDTIFGGDEEKERLRRLMWWWRWKVYGWDIRRLASHHNAAVCSSYFYSFIEEYTENTKFRGNRVHKWRLMHLSDIIRTAFSLSVATQINPFKFEWNISCLCSIEARSLR